MTRFIGGIMKKLFILVILLGLQLVFAQQMEEYIISSDGQNVYVFITRPLEPGEGALLQKMEGNTWKNVTTGAIRPLDDPYQLQRLMGEDYLKIARVLRNPDPGQILQKLNVDPVYSLLLCLRYPRLGMLMGRLIMDSSPKTGEKMKYRVLFLNKRNEIRKTGKELTIQVIPPTISEVSLIHIAQQNRIVDISFRYPRFSWDKPDPIVGFHIYRSDDGKNFIRVTDEMIYRLDEEELHYQDGLLVYGKTYWYKITGVTFYGSETAGKISNPITLKDMEAPAAVQYVSARFVDKGILVSWKPSLESDIQGYLVYRGSRLEEVNQLLTPKPLPSSSFSYLDSTGMEGQQYFYGVIAIDMAGNKSPMSAKGNAVWPDKTPPEPPQQLKAVYNRQNKRVELSWSQNSREKLRGYYVYRGKSKDNMTQLTQKPIQTYFADSGYGEKKFNAGEGYLYAVRAVDMAWNLSDFSYATVQIPDTIPPLPPTGVLIDIRQNGDVLLSWNPSPSVDVEKYEIALKKEIDKEFTVLSMVGKDTIRGFIPRLEKGNVYQFRIRAIDRAGNVSPDGLVKKEMVRDFSPPPHPRNVFYRKTEKGYVITWNKVVDFDLLGYKIYRAVSPTAEYFPVSDQIITDTSFILPIDSPEGFYQIRAVDSSGNESKDNEIIHIHP